MFSTDLKENCESFDQKSDWVINLVYNKAKPESCKPNGLFAYEFNFEN